MLTSSEYTHIYIYDYYVSSILTLSNSFPVPQENQSLLGVTDLDSSEWKAYTDYVDRIILTGFCSAVRCSLQYFMDNTDAAQRITPLFEVQLVLNGNEMTFEPPLDYSYSGNFYDIVDKMVANITHMASFIPRVAKHKQLDNYQVLYTLDCRFIRIVHAYTYTEIYLHIHTPLSPAILSLHLVVRHK